MADFKTHLTGGVAVGAVLSGISLYSLELDIIQSFAVFCMGLFGGILPDLDSDSGKPLELISGTISVLIPALLLHKISSIDIVSPEFLISYFTFCYLMINYVICGLIKKMTVHRGIMHSIPFSLLSAEIAYLLFRTSGLEMSTMAALAVFLGCIVHLLLDELHSFYFKFGFIPMLKKSSGSALKLYSEGIFASFFIYSLVIAVAVIIFRNA